MYLIQDLSMENYKTLLKAIQEDVKDMFMDWKI